MLEFVIVSALALSAPVRPATPTLSCDPAAKMITLHVDPHDGDISIALPALPPTGAVLHAREDGIDLRFTLARTDRSADDPTNTYPSMMTEEVFWLAPEPPVATLQVASIRIGQAAGRLHLELDCSPDAATPPIRARANAAIAFSRADAKPADLSRRKLAADALSLLDKLAEQDGNALDIAWAIQGLAYLKDFAGEHAAARIGLLEAAAAWRRAHRPDLAVPALFSAGQSALAQSALDAAAEDQHAAMQAAKELKLGYWYTMSHQELCLIQRYRAKLDEAIACYREVIAEFRRLKQEAQMQNALRNLISAYRVNGRIPEALQTMKQARELVQRTHENEADLLLAHARLLHDSGDLVAAVDTYLEAAASAERANDVRIRPDVNLRLSTLYYDVGDLERAELFLGLAEASPRMSQSAFRTRALLLRSRLVEAERPLATDAARLLHEALTTARTSGRNDLVLNALIGLTRHGESLADLGETRDWPTLIKSTGGDVEMRASIALALREAALRRIVGNAGSADPVIEEIGEADAALAREDLPIGLRVARERIKALELARRGDVGAAWTTTLLAVAPVKRLLQQTAIPVLRSALRRESHTLLHLASDLAADNPGLGDQPHLCELWNNLESTRAELRGTRATSANSARIGRQADQSISRALLSPAESLSAEDRRQIALDLATVELAANHSASLDTEVDPSRLCAALRSIGEDEVVIEYLLGMPRSYALVARDHALHLVPLTGLDRIHDASMALVASKTDARAYATHAKQLHEWLVSPLQIDSARDIRIVADNILWKVPVGVYAPAAARSVEESTVAVGLALRLLGDAPEQTFQGSAGFGIGVPLELAGAKEALPALPGAIAEMEWLASANTVAARSFVEAKATIEALEKQAQSPLEFLHVATHAVSDPQRWYHAGLILHSGKEHRGELLGPAAVQQWKVRTRTVLLNACASSEGAVTMGAPLSLSRSFLEAGAKEVIASLWPIGDVTSLHFVQAFHAPDLRNANSAERVARASASLRERTRFRQPEDWAPFLLIRDHAIDGVRETALTQH